MWKIILSMILPLFYVNAYSHLCDDVFLQANDNLAVKVDIRDGQLRVNRSANFRVYLLNTMDRPVLTIKLEVDSKEFTTRVTPAPDWISYPMLDMFKKVYFEVELTRKKNITEGKYRIGLRLVDGFNTNRILKAMDMNEAVMETMEIPAAARINLDGEATASEWGKSLLCTSLYEYKSVNVEGRQNINSQYIKVDTGLQTRFRFANDEKNLYCLVDFINKGDKNINNAAEIYIAKDMNSEPDIFYVNLNKKKAAKNVETAGILSGFKDEKAEIVIPFSLISLGEDKSFYMNMRRRQEDKDGKVLFLSYWRGNAFSYKNPLVYPKFVLK